ncbi:MAG: penicillin-binding protein 2 [Holosporales bacterium]
MSKRGPSPDEGKQVFSRRAFLLGMGKALLGTALVGRLVYLGGFKASHYRTLADGNRIKLHIELPHRGMIYDRVGQALATNLPVFRLALVPDQAKDLGRVLARIERLVGLGDHRLVDVFRQIKRQPRFLPYTVIPQLDFEAMCRLQLHMADLPGCQIIQGFQRSYPHPEETAHVVGYVQIPSDQDQVDPQLARQPDFRLGKSGLERHFQDQLCGTPGFKEVEVDALRRIVRELSHIPSHPGEALHTSLHLELQQSIYHTLKERESAAAVVMEIPSGEIWGLASHPSFDANLFVNGIRARDWQGLVQNPYGALNAKTIKGLYAPGSTFKMMVALAALHSGRIDEHTTVFCPGHMDVGSHRFHCWRTQHGHGTMNLTEAISQSCDVFFYECAKKIGIEAIAQMAQVFGFGEVTGINLPGERAGLVPTKAWKQKRFSKPWTMGDTINVSIGQGSLMVTPLQLATMTARLATGRRIVPTLIKNAGREFDLLDLDPKFLDMVRQGMDRVVNVPTGSAYGARIDMPGFEMAGKTGTSQVKRISMHERRTRVLKNEERPWKEREHSLFCAFAPVQQPRFVVSVVVEHGGGGSRVAAPIARDILIKTQMIAAAE